MGISRSIGDSREELTPISAYRRAFVGADADLSSYVVAEEGHLEVLTRSLAERTHLTFLPGAREAK
jgi:hypothetical protein